MFDHHETKVGKSEAWTKAGLEILFEKPDAKESRTTSTKNVSMGELRERFWIRLVKSDRSDRKYSTVNLSGTYRIERDEIGLRTDDPGDGFRYVFWWGDERGNGSGAEWFEVTEVFEVVEPKEIEAFMKINNGRTVDFNFDPSRFLSDLRLSIPNRAAQQRAADKVVNAVAKKLRKESYKGMNQRHGYGTLIVGLPLWFATLPKNPLRVGNVLDEFYTRIRVGLNEFKSCLKMKNCPFWRIEVMWVPTIKSLREWRAKAFFDVYDDPAYRKLTRPSFKFESMATVEHLVLSATEKSRSEGESLGARPISVCVVSSKRQPSEASLILPPKIRSLKQALNRNSKRREWEKPLASFKLRVFQRLLSAYNFVYVFGLLGVKRLHLTRLSPRVWISHYVLTCRARKLYQTSLRRTVNHVPNAMSCRR